MAFDFPSSPSEGQQYTPAGGPTYTYNAPRWVSSGSGSPQGFKNRIINGDFAVDQRGITVVGAASLQVYAGADRWFGSCAVAPGALTMQRGSLTAIAPGEYYLLVTPSIADAALAAGDNYNFGQRIEGYNVRDLNWGNVNAKSITISFLAQSNVALTLPISLRNAASNRAWLGSFTLDGTATWTKIIIAVSGDVTGTWEYGNLNGISVQIGLGVGTTFQGVAGWQAGNFLSLAGMTNFMASTSNILYLRDFQVETGTVATEFARVPYDQQLLRCMRYYCSVGDTTFPVTRFYAPAAGAILGVPMPFTVPMRAAPTSAKVGTWGVANSNQPVIANVSPTGFVPSASSLAVGDGYFFPDSADDKFTFSAEL